MPLLRLPASQLGKGPLQRRSHTPSSFHPVVQVGGRMGRQAGRPKGVVLRQNSGVTGAPRRLSMAGQQREEVRGCSTTCVAPQHSISHHSRCRIDKLELRLTHEPGPTFSLLLLA